MKKLIYSVFTLLALSLIIAGCDGDSYEKRLKKERRAISQFIADNGIDVIYDYPSDHKFKKNEFYLEGSTGVYLHVVSSGNIKDTLAKDDRIPVYIHFDSVAYLVKDSVYRGNNYAGQSPMEFTYGVPTTYLDNTGASSLKYTFMSPACVLPFDKSLGNGAVVDLIVPFLNGSSYQRSYYEPMKFTRMTYTFHKQIEPEKPKE